MIISRLILSGLLLASSLVSHAQDSSPVATPKLYVGLAVYGGPYHSLRFKEEAGINARIPVQAVLGYQLRPRLALQAGLVYSGYKRDYSYSYNYLDTNTNQVQYSSSNTFTLRTFDASLLARYTLTRKAIHRFQVDLVGGLRLTHQRSHQVGTENYSYTSPSQGPTTVRDYDDFYRYNALSLDLGPGFRYRFGQRLEAVGDILFNLPVTNTYRSLNSSLALGLRYRFGPS